MNPTRIARIARMDARADVFGRNAFQLRRMRNSMTWGNWKKSRPEWCRLYVFAYGEAYQRYSYERSQAA